MGKTYRGLTRIGSTVEARSGIDRLQWKCDNMKSLAYECYNTKLENVDELFDGLDVSNVEDFSYLFYQAYKLKSLPELKSKVVKNINYMLANQNMNQAFNSATLEEIDLTGLEGEAVYCNYLVNYRSNFKKIIFSPNLKITNLKNGFTMGYQPYASLEQIEGLNTSECTDFSGAFSSQQKLKSLLLNNTSKGTTFSNMCLSCTSLVTVETIDLISATSASSLVNGCTKLENLTVKNVKINLQIGSGTSYGRLLTDESLINTAKELWDMTGSTSKTLTASTDSKARFDAIYVKLVDVTDEMRAEDEYIDNKKPCVVCESTDEGAMTLKEYVVSKNWALA